MLQKIGDSLKGKKILAWIILAPLALVFVAWGATGAVNLDFMGPQTYAAKVNGERIEQEEANRLWQDEQSRWQQQVGTDIPEDIRKDLQEGVLERLIRATLVTERSREAGYRVSGTRVQEEIRNEQAFQVEGKYNETLALARLAQVGISADTYRADVRKSLQNEELQRALFVSEFVTPTEIGRRIALEDEQREVRYATFTLDKYRAAIKPTEAELSAWFTKNSAQFLTPETVRLQYAEGSLAEASAAVVVADSDLQELYAKNKDRYVEPERRRARHILLPTEKAANEALTQLKGGADFAALAAKISTDTGSAAQGGDLGFSPKSAFVGPFAEAVFSMKQGELRGPVKSEFGYHVIRLEGIEAGRSKSYDEVKAELDTEFRRDRAADLFGEKQEQAQRRIEQSGADLATIAKELGLTLSELPVYTRGVGGGAFINNPELESVVFGDAVLNQRRIGGPVPAGEDRFVLVKALEHRKPVVPPLAEVRARVLEAVTREQAAAAALKAAQSVAAIVKDGASFEQMLKGLGLKVEAARYIDRRDPAVPAALRDTAFAMPRPKDGKSELRALALPEGGAAVVMLSASRVMPASGDAVVRQARAQQIVGRQGQSAVSAYVEDLRDKAKITKNELAFQ